MYFMAVESLCEMDLGPVWDIVGFIVDAIWFGIPLLLIILGSIDLGKAVIASKEDEVKKAWKAFGRRFLYAVAVFAVVWVVTLVFDTVGKLDLNDVTASDTSGWKACWCQIRDNCPKK